MPTTPERLRICRSITVMLLVAGFATPTPALAQHQAGDDYDSTVTASSAVARHPNRRPPSVPPTFRLQDYGSNANFNPFSMLLNRGFDMWQVQQYSPNLFEFPYARTAGAVWHSLTHPAQTIEAYGSERFWKNEVFPLSLSPGQPAWLANYSLHFFQGGVTYVQTEGWMAERGWPAPRLLAGTLTFAAAYITEMTEAEIFPHGGLSAGLFADLVFFDLGGILVFSIPAVRNFVDDNMEVLDWSLQPVITPQGELRNAGDFFAIRIGLPLVDRVDFITRVGIGAWAGVSYRHNRTDAISLMFGKETLTREFRVDTGHESITMGFSGGMFYDRNGSLLAGVEWGVRDRLVSANIYPRVLPGFLRDTGLWIALDRGMRPRIGLVTSRLGFGLGVLSRPPRPN